MAISVDYTRDSFSSTRPPDYTKGRPPQYNGQNMTFNQCLLGRTETRMVIVKRFTGVHDFSATAQFEHPWVDLISVYGDSGHPSKGRLISDQRARARSPPSSNYDCVAIGSGYGGTAALARMACQGEPSSNVERGHERWPVEPPDNMSSPCQQEGTPSPMHVGKRLREPSLDERFKMVPSARFHPGEVFKVLWHEPDAEVHSSGSSFEETYPSQEIYEKALRDDMPACLSMNLTLPGALWEVSRATSAATTYFRPFSRGNLNFVDGAISNNNPVSKVEIETELLWRDREEMVVSIGTGKASIPSAPSSTASLPRSNHGQSLPLDRDYEPWSIVQSQLRHSKETSLSHLQHTFKATPSKHVSLESMRFYQTMLASTTQTEAIIDRNDHLILSHNGIRELSDLTRALYQAYLEQGIFGIIEQVIDLLSPPGEVPAFDDPPLLFKYSCQGKSRKATTWNIVSRLLAPGIIPLEDPG